MALSTWLPLVARSSHDLHVDNPLGGCRKRDTRSHAPDSAVPTFDIERVRRCLLDPRKQRRALGGCGRERASIGVIAKPRQGQWRLATAYARTDRLTLGVLGAHPSNLRSTSSTIRRHCHPDHALLHPQEGAASRNCSVRGMAMARAGGPAPVCVTPGAWLLMFILSCSSHCSQPPSGESRSCS